MAKGQRIVGKRNDNRCYLSFTRKGSVYIHGGFPCIYGGNCQMITDTTFFTNSKKVNWTLAELVKG